MAIAADGGFVYWTTYAAGTVARVPTVGGQVETIATSQGKPDSIAVGGGLVYWVNSSDPAAGVVTASAAGGPTTQLASLAGSAKCGPL